MFNGNKSNKKKKPKEKKNKVIYIVLDLRIKKQDQNSIGNYFFMF